MTDSIHEKKNMIYSLSNMKMPDRNKTLLIERAGDSLLPFGRSASSFGGIFFHSQHFSCAA